jgi:hypothetical protein
MIVYFDLAGRQPGEQFAVHRRAWGRRRLSVGAALAIIGTISLMLWAAGIALIVHFL